MENKNSSRSQTSNTQETLNTSNMSNSAVNQNINQNFSSIVNLQQHNQSVFSQVFDIIQENWDQYKINQFQSQEQKNKDGVSEEFLQRFNIEPEEFNGYKNKVLQGLKRHNQQKEIIFKDSNMLQDIDLGQYLVKCYKSVPSVYMQDKFVFDFSMLTKNSEEFYETQEKITEYLDEVDLNLFYQIQSRFDEFLAMILNFNQMTTSIDNCLNQISYIRGYNQKLKGNLIKDSLVIIEKKKKIHKIDQTIKLMETLKTLHTTIPKINQLVEEGKYQYAVDLLHSSEELYNQHQFAALRKYKDSIQSARKKLEQNVFSLFQTYSLRYIIEGLAYEKRSSNNNNNSGSAQNLSRNHSSTDGQDESMMNNSTFLNETMDNNKLLNISQYLEEQQKQHNIPWKLTKCDRNKEKEEQIACIVLQSYNLVEFSARNYRAKLKTYLKDNNQQYLTDVKQFFVDFLDQEQQAKINENLNSKKKDQKKNEEEEGDGLSEDQQDNFNQNNNNNNNNYQQEEFIKIDYSAFQLEDLAQKIPLELFIKIVIFYIESLKRTLKQQLYLNQTVIQHLILYVQKEFQKNMYFVQQSQQTKNNQKNNNNNIQLDKQQEKEIQNQLKIVNEIIDEFYQIIERMVIQFNKQLVDFLNLKDFKDCADIHIFKKIISIFQNWDYFIDNDLQKLMNVQVEDQQNLNIILQKILYKNGTVQFQKISLSILNNHRMEIEKDFIDKFYKIQRKNLKEALEQDYWMPSDVGYEFYDIFRDLLQDQVAQSSIKEHLDEQQDLQPEEGMQLITARIMEDDDGNTARDLNSSVFEDGLQSQRNSSQPGNNQNQQNQKFQIKILKKEIFINEQKFKVTSAFLVFVKGIKEFFKLAYSYIKSQNNRADTLQSLVKYMIYYHERSYSLIVDGKAISFKVIKKNINSKNLAMSALCLELVNSFILPQIYIQVNDQFESYMEEQKQEQQELNSTQQNEQQYQNDQNNVNNNNQNDDMEQQQQKQVQLKQNFKKFQNLLQEFQNANQQYNSHINTIFNTISSILIELLHGQCKKIGQLKWNDQQETIECPTRQTAQVLDNLRNMYLAIEDFFMNNQLLRIFERCFEEMITTYLPTFEQIEITSKIGAKRVKDELEYAQQDLANLGFIHILPEELFLKLENEIIKIIDDKCYTFLADNQN